MLTLRLKQDLGAKCRPLTIALAAAGMLFGAATASGQPWTVPGPLVAEETITFADGINPFSGGTLVDDHFFTDGYSLHLDQTDQAVWDLPTAFLGAEVGSIQVQMQVFDQGLYIDPDVTGAPSHSRNGGRWGVSAVATEGDVDPENYTGVGLGQWPFLSSGTGYAWNADNTRWGTWFSPAFFGSPRQVEELGDGGSATLLPEEEWEDPETPEFEWNPPQPGVGAWSQWSFDGTSDGNVVVDQAGIGQAPRSTNIGGGIEQVWLFGGSTGVNGHLAGIWVDEVIVQAFEASAPTPEMNVWMGINAEANPFDDVNDAFDWSQGFVPGPGEAAVFNWDPANWEAEADPSHRGDLHIQPGAFNPDHIVHDGTGFPRPVADIVLRRDLEVESITWTTGLTTSRASQLHVGFDDGEGNVECHTLTVTHELPLFFGGDQGGWQSIQFIGDSVLEFAGDSQASPAARARASRPRSTSGPIPCTYAAIRRGSVTARA